LVIERGGFIASSRIGGRLSRFPPITRCFYAQNTESRKNAVRWCAVSFERSHFRGSPASWLHARRAHPITGGPHVRPVLNLVSSGLSTPVEASAAVYRFFAGEQVLQGLHHVVPLLPAVAFRVRPHREASHCGDTEHFAIRQDCVCNTPLQTRNVRQAEDGPWHRSVERPPHPVF
jgi:hypothetical protein